MLSICYFMYVVNSLQ